MAGPIGSSLVTPQKLTASGEGVHLEYWPVLHSSPQHSSVNSSLQQCQVHLVVMPAGGRWPAGVLSPDGQDCSSSLVIRVNLSELEPDMAAQFAALPLPFNQHRTLTDPAVLHLIHLLQQEMQSPQPMSQMFFAAIIHVLINALTR